VLDGVRHLPGVMTVSRSDGRLRVELDDLARVPDLIASLAAAGARLTRVTPHEPTLEELYFAVRSGALTADAPADGEELVARAPSDTDDLPTDDPVSVG
jgi:hypothetical protein